MTLESDSSNSGGHRVVQFLARHPKAIVGLVFLILAILGCLLSSTIANQGLQHRIKAIRARHEPVTVDDLNALLPDAPADQNMYPILLRCAQAIEGLEVPREMQDSLPWVGRARYPRSGELLTPEQLSAAKWYLEKQAANLAEIHSALRLKNCGPTSRLTSPLAQRTVPIVPLIHLPEILAIETASRWSVSDGRGNEDRLLEMLPLLGVMKADPFLLAGVIQQCIDRSFVDLVERTLNICPLSESALKTLDKNIEELGRQTLQTELKAERVYFLDYYAYERQVRIKNSRLNLKGMVIRYLPGTLELNASNVLDCYGDVIEAAGLHTARGRHRLKTIEQQFSSEPWYSTILCPSLTSQVAMQWKYWAEIASFRVALAGERFRLKNSRWPTSDADLVPSYLPEIPMDPYDDKPIRYRQTDEGFLAWSVGDDEIDNGGKIGRRPELSARGSGADFGWIILNPSLRGRAVGTVTSSPATPD